MTEPDYDSIRDKELDEYLLRTDESEEIEESEGDNGESDSPAPYNPADKENRWMDFIN